MKVDNFNKHLFNEYSALYMALNIHRTHKNKLITLKNYEYLKQIYLDRSNYIVFRKATQIGITEYLVIAAIDKVRMGRGVFYVLPTDRIASRFVKNRIDTSINFTPYYKSLIQKCIAKYSESVSLKHIGKGSIAFIGSNASAGFTEFPADDLIIDELDECDAENIPMAEERLSASTDKRKIFVGNPTIADYGIDNEYNESDMKQWFLKCSHCNNWFVPDYFIHVVRKDNDINDYVIQDGNYERESKRDIYLICDKCEKPVDRYGQGEWVKKYPDKVKSGYHVSKLFSTNMKLTELIDRHDKGLKNDTILQRFYNGDLGLPFTSEGSKITVDILNKCKRDYNMPAECQDVCLAGIDVGKKLHIRISKIWPEGKLKSVYIGTVDSVDDIKNLLELYNVQFGCVDSLPELRTAKKICSLIRGMCRVIYTTTGKKDTIDRRNKIITVDRTASLDQVKEMILDQRDLLPQNADKLFPIVKTTQGDLSEFYRDMIASTRIEVKGRYDNDKPAFKWVEVGPDHFFHSSNYLWTAYKLRSKMR